MSSYTARVTRDEDAWSIEVPEVHRTTQALNLRQVEPMARDLIAIMNDVATDSFDLHIEWPAEIARPLAELHGLQAQAESLRSRTAETQIRLATDLRESGETMRDIAAVMGLSFQRVQQLVSAGDARTGGR